MANTAQHTISITAQYTLAVAITAQHASASTAQHTQAVAITVLSHSSHQSHSKLAPIRQKASIYTATQQEPITLTHAQIWHTAGTYHSQNMH